MEGRGCDWVVGGYEIRSCINMHTHTDTHFSKCWIQRSILNISSCILFIVQFKDLHTKGYLSGIVRVFTCNLYIDTSVLILCGPCACVCI